MLDVRTVELPPPPAILVLEDLGFPVIFYDHNVENIDIAVPFDISVVYNATHIVDDQSVRYKPGNKGYDENNDKHHESDRAITHFLIPPYIF